eukprot:798760-Prymnesium_polylepis.1
MGGSWRYKIKTQLRALPRPDACRVLPVPRGIVGENALVRLGSAACHGSGRPSGTAPVSYTHLRAHETLMNL